MRGPDVGMLRARTRRVVCAPGVDLPDPSSPARPPPSSVLPLLIALKRYSRAQKIKGIVPAPALTDTGRGGAAGVAAAATPGRHNRPLRAGATATDCIRRRGCSSTKRPFRSADH